MIRMVASYSAEAAKKYFSDALVKSDYYMADLGQEHPGIFQGKLSERLGITGKADKKTFFDLCENINPRTGKRLTQSTKANRLTGWDINFHAPKSLSILAALSSDFHIQDAFQECVTLTMQDIERDSKTRIRKGGVYADRDTGELAWCSFLHQTARPTPDHTCDPHLHVHAFCIQATYDAVENEIKAAQWRHTKIDMPYYQARFHKLLSDRMIDLGYRVRRTDHAFEIEGVPQEAIAHFSKRTDEIGRAAEKLGIKDSKRKDALGAKTRSKKQKGLTMAELKTDWRRQLQGLKIDKKEDQPIRFAPSIERELKTADQSLHYAVQHSFERVSCMDERRVLRAAFRHALGHREVSIGDIEDRFAKDRQIIRVKEGSRTMVTTKTVLQEERRMVQLARAGIGQLAPLYHEVPALNVEGQQADAIGHVLTTRDRVSIVMGAAGVGKTTLFREMTGKITDAKVKVFAFAPTAEAVRVLKEEGFAQAETIAKLLVDTKLQKQLKGQVLLVDEAGLLGNRDMIGVLEIAERQDARLILGGDTRQHASILRGESLKVLNLVGKIKAAEVTKIRRQENLQYREAVQSLADGKVKAAFDKLDEIDAVKQIDPLDPTTALVDDYLAARKKGKSVLVISPTHKQGEEVTGAIRAKLRQAGKIGKREVSARKLDNLNYTEAEKSDYRSYQEGQVIQFNQNTKQIKRGTAWTVKKVVGKEIQIENPDGLVLPLPLKKAGQFDVYEQSVIGLSKNDRVRITRNFYDENKKRLNNGMHLEVVSFEKDGKVILRNKSSKARYTVDRNNGNIAHAHVITSYASQGKTCDTVLIHQPSATFAATDLRQFYVSVSRGKHNVKIYTDDKEALLEHAAEMGDRQSALELIAKKSQADHVQDQQRVKPGRIQPKTRNKEFTVNKQEINTDYEPSF